MKFTEEQLKIYAAPLSETENQKCLNAISMVRDALKKLGLTDDNKPILRMHSDTYAYVLEMRGLYTDRKVKIFVQGSYANDTNVRTESDVDVAIIQEEVFKPVYRTGITGSNYNFSDAPIPSKTFKDEVQECLVDMFGNDVERRNKSVKVHGNTYRKDIDTVPCMRYRDYSEDYRFDETNFMGGIVITADTGEVILNYPEQHIRNGLQKNGSTERVYKRMVRIIKKMRYLMEDKFIASASNVSSFVLESLLWNIPDNVYLKYKSIYRFTFDEVIQYAHSNKSSFIIYKEANGIKPLCPTQKDVDSLQKFISDLIEFYQYDIKEN